MGKITLLILCLFFAAISLQAQELMRSTVGVAGASNSFTQGSKTFLVQHSVGQGSVIGTFKSGGITLRQGFIQPPSISATIIEEDSNLQASVYPNPFSDTVNISFGEEVKGELGIVLYDMLGRKVYDTKRRATQEMSINLQDLSTAQYIMIVSLGKKQFKANLIKK